MRQIRFRFDGQPINETDTPSQVNQLPVLLLHFSASRSELQDGLFIKDEVKVHIMSNR